MVRFSTILMRLQNFLTHITDDLIFYHKKSIAHRLKDEKKHEPCHICGKVEVCPNVIINDECEVTRYIVYFKNVPVNILQKTVQYEMPEGKIYKFRHDGSFIDMKALAVSICEECFDGLKNTYEKSLISISPGHTHSK